MISLGALVRKIKDGQVEVIINKLCSNMTSDDEKLRDISSVGKSHRMCVTLSVCHTVCASHCMCVTLYVRHTVCESHCMCVTL